MTNCVLCSTCLADICIDNPRIVLFYPTLREHLMMEYALERYYIGVYGSKMFIYKFFFHSMCEEGKLANYIWIIETCTPSVSFSSRHGRKMKIKEMQKESSSRQLERTNLSCTCRGRQKKKESSKHLKQTDVVASAGCGSWFRVYTHAVWQEMNDGICTRPNDTDGVQVSIIQI